ncbi:hypothetical protein [Patulibacter defluvii]|uniref:hypothetical protein n=1 Tax=Patulibacter defluvii TaxID=3095358 RepID=UPI002A755363|nr:hypothetical protein [Patulibacter sp. DM4]
MEARAGAADAYGRAVQLGGGWSLLIVGSREPGFWTGGWFALAGTSLATAVLATGPFRNRPYAALPTLLGALVVAGSSPSHLVHLAAFGAILFWTLGHPPRTPLLLGALLTTGLTGVCVAHGDPWPSIVIVIVNGLWLTLGSALIAGAWRGRATGSARSRATGIRTAEAVALERDARLQVAGEIHDGPLQTLYAAALHIDDPRRATDTADLLRRAAIELRALIADAAVESRHRPGAA